MSAETLHVPHDNTTIADEPPAVQAYSTFDEMPLPQHLLRGIYAYGFEKPSAIQQRAIVPLIKGGDIIAQAQSGTGKTAAFTIGLLARVDFGQQTLQGLVLVPTRELAIATSHVVRQLGEFLTATADKQQIFCQAFVGGVTAREDITRIEQGGLLVAVGTPGRVLDLAARGVLRTAALKVLVLDEADEMLSRGFSEQIYDIFKYLPTDSQVALFSATMPEEVLALTHKCMRAPTSILVKRDELTLEGIRQFYIAVEEEHKLETITDLLEMVPTKGTQVLIVVNTRRKVEFIYEKINAQANNDVSTLHGEMTREEREDVINAFQAGSSRVLITTDLLLSGIRVRIGFQNVLLVVNYDLPKNVDNYIHRVGHSDRFGRKRVAISFVDDMRLLRDIENYYAKHIEELPMDFACYLGGE